MTTESATERATASDVALAAGRSGPAPPALLDMSALSVMSGGPFPVAMAAGVHAIMTITAITAKAANSPANASRERPFAVPRRPRPCIARCLAVMTLAPAAG
ncbi:hypothetical protein DA2_1231 [Desulfovibrio sp. A2]|nr:hypothetical protein DA2_1231 [Desulfovibrio sp. A2]